MNISTNEFKNSKNKCLTLLGMSGVGKTHLAKLLAKQAKYFHYSGDYRIGTKYLNQAILYNIKTHVKQYNWFNNLLKNNTISIQNNITFDNLSSISTFLSKVGNPELDGLPIEEFKRRQDLFKQAEKDAMLDVPKFIEKAQSKGIDNFINDAGGSLCEIDDDDIYKKLAKHTAIIYIRASNANESALIERAKTYPKPVYYNAEFLTKQLNIYLKNKQIIYVAQINPDDFVRWVFPRLLAHRKPKYEAIAKKYGYTISSEDLYQCKNADEVLTLIYKAMN